MCRTARKINLLHQLIISNSLLSSNSIHILHRTTLEFQGLESSKANKCRIKELQLLRPDAHQHPRCDYICANHCPFQLVPEKKAIMKKSVLFSKMTNFAVCRKLYQCLRHKTLKKKKKAFITLKVFRNFWDVRLIKNIFSKKKKSQEANTIIQFSYSFT